MRNALYILQRAFRAGGWGSRWSSGELDLRSLTVNGLHLAEKGVKLGEKNRLSKHEQSTET
jgi:hypothetical protein